MRQEAACGNGAPVRFFGNNNWSIQIIRHNTHQRKARHPRRSCLSTQLFRVCDRNKDDLALIPEYIAAIPVNGWKTRRIRKSRSGPADRTSWQRPEPRRPMRYNLLNELIARFAMDVFKTFSIDAAHYLPGLPEGHKCGRLHGHSFRIEVHVTGPVEVNRGWVVDFADIKRSFAPLFEQLDHRCLNEIEGLANPTSENIARWIWKRLKPDLPGLSLIVVMETASAGCSFDGQDAGGAGGKI